jgi:hypothetical protein
MLLDSEPLTLMRQGNPDAVIDDGADSNNYQETPDERRSMISPATLRHNETVDWLVSCDPLTVVLWLDPKVDTSGFDALGEYTEMFWLPIIGPTATLALRRLCRWTDESPNGFRVTRENLAVTLGLGKATSRNSSLIRTLVRLVDFGFARREGDHLAVRRVVPVVPPRLTERFPVGLANRHDQVLDALDEAAVS